MYVKQEELVSAISELKELHQGVHKASYHEQLNKIKKGEELGCPICDIGGDVINNEEMMREVEEMVGRAIPHLAILSKLFSLDFDLKYCCLTFLSIGIMIGRKQAQNETMKI